MDQFRLIGEVIQDSTFKGNRQRTVRTFLHEPSGLKVVFCDIEGPVCGASVVVLTECDNDKGLPHTLEHLVFCGSAQYPDRGFLDTLATRCLTDGTNAWTSDDHTAYTVETVGSKGMENILPVFLDHVFHPNLRDAQFITEVYHVDGEGKEQGVVFCEMSGCENTEVELMDNEIKKIAYANAGYSYSYGGKMADIATLTNEEIKKYHKKYYFPANVAVILSGMLDPAAILPLIAKVNLPLESSLTERVEPWASVECKPFEEHIFRTVDFPSEDNEVGSASFAWRGPHVSDLETAVALEILLLFMADSSASPFPQRFVEHDPIASYVGYQYKPYVMSTVIINFDGVTIPEHIRKTLDVGDEGDSDDGESTGSEDEEEDESKGKSAESPYSRLPKIEKEKLYDEGYFRGLVYELLGEVAHQLALEGEASASIQKAIKRYEKKWFEKLEDEPHELVASSVILELVQMSPGHLKSPFTYKFGQRLNITGIIKRLGERPTSFWIELLKRWFIDAHCLEVKTMPNPQMAEDISQKEQKALETRVKRMGPAGLKKAKEALARAVKENQVNLPEEILARMPPVPPSRDLSLLPEVVNVVGKGESSMPAVLVSTSTRFCHLRLCLDTSLIPLELRSYLVLFQELLLESDVQLPGGPLLPWTAVVEAINEDTVTLECGVGFGNSTFTCSYLSSIFYVYGISEPESFHLLCQHISNMVLFTQFSIERVLTMTKNLLNDIVEQNREGSEVAEAVMIQKTEQASSNMRYLSVLHQQPFLKKILKKLSSKAESSRETYAQVVLVNLEKVREHLLNNISQAFCQLSTAQGENGEAKLKQFLEHWDQQLELFQEQKKSAKVSRPQRKKTKSSTPDLSQSQANPWPAKRVSYSPVQKEIALCVPVEGLDVSYLSSLVPCEIFLSPDYYPVLVLAEVLSGTEGPLYTSIRGQGFAYGAVISIYKWYGQVAFNVREASSPDKALECFHEILRTLPSKADKILSDFAIETAKAAVTFRMYSQRATPGQVIGKTLENTLMGFETPAQERESREQLALVTREDLLRVYHKYFAQFLEGPGRVTVLTTGQKNVKKYTKTFALKPLGIKLQTKTLKQLSSER